MTAVPTLSLALLAGLLSCLSPCVLPLIPSYLGVLGGSRSAWTRALAFIAGFTLVFVALGASASFLGQWLAPHKILLGRLGGVLIIVFGVFMLGIWRPFAMQRDYRALLGRAGRSGPLLLGVAFGFGWSPCIGPILGSILTLAAASQSLGTGVALLAVYSVGLAIPFMLLAFFWQRLNTRALSRYTHLLERAGGALLVTVGVLMVTGEFTRLAGIALQLMPNWLQGRI